VEKTATVAGTGADGDWGLAGSLSWGGCDEKSSENCVIMRSSLLPSLHTLGCWGWNWPRSSFAFPFFALSNAAASSSLDCESSAKGFLETSAKLGAVFPACAAGALTGSFFSSGIETSNLWLTINRKSNT